MTKRALFAVAGLAFLPAAAMAQVPWSDNFDSYPTGVNINGMGGWQGWGGVANQAPVTTAAQALSPVNSILVSGSGDTGTPPTYSDNVHQFTGASSGTGWYEYKANIYVPANTTGSAYFILMNTYADPSGPFNWSIEYQINGTNNTFSDDYTNGTSGVSGAGNSRNGTNRTLIRDRWVEIKVDFNLTTNVMQTWYDGTPVSGGSWKTNATSVLNMVATDMYSGTSTGVYFDNLSLNSIPGPGSLAILGLGGLIAGRRRRS